MEKAADRVIEMLRTWVVVCVCLHASYIFLAQPGAAFSKFRFGHFEALAWSFTILLVDKMPHQRHTHQEFNSWQLWQRREETGQCTRRY